MATAAAPPVVVLLGDCHWRVCSVSGRILRPISAAAPPASNRGRLHAHLLSESRVAVGHADRSALPGSRRGHRCRAAESDEPPESPSTSSESPSSVVDEGIGEQVRKESRRVRGDSGPRREADSTDPVSTSLSRRFGLAGGLAWAGFLAFGVISEQIKTRTEVAQESEATQDVKDAKEVVLDDGVRFVDLRSGGGASPVKRDLVLLDVKGRVSRTGEVFLDGKRPVAFVYGVRPFPRGICAGLETGLESMKAGGKRRITVPAAQCFGDAGEQMSDGIVVPRNEDVEFEVELQRVSIAPS